jgi:TolB-like protein
VNESSAEGESSSSSEGNGHETRPPEFPVGPAESVGPAGPLEVWARIRDHKVLQWGLAYLGAALAIAHAGELLGHTFNWPELTNRILMSGLIVGLPIALALAWYHGHRSLRSVSAGEATIISLLVVIGAGLLVVFARPPAEALREALAPVPSAGTSPVAAAPTQAARSAEAKATVLPKGPSIAVLPFVNMSSDPEQDYFSDGLAEELLNQLAHLSNLRVIGRTSSFAFKGKSVDLRVIGQALGVDHILEGSVRKAGNHVRITAQLIDPATGSDLWSDVYDKQLGDIFAIQEEIARTVAANLRIRIDNDLGEVSTRNLQAYDEYLRAKRSGVGPGGDFATTIRHLERAVALDPQFTGAWLMLVEAYNGAILNLPERSAEFVAKQEQSLNHALALAPESAPVKVALAAREAAKGNLAKAEQLLVSIKDLPPGLTANGYVSYALFAMSVGRPREAMEVLERARQADPLWTFPPLLLQICHESVGELDAAEAEYQRSLALGDRSELLAGTVLVRAMSRKDAEALRSASAETRLSPAEVNHQMVLYLDEPRAGIAALRRIIDDPGFSPSIVRSVVIAQWAAYFGDPALSLQALRTMPRSGPSGSVLFSLWRPLEKETRRLPEFKEYVRERGLVDYWRTTGKWGEFCRPVRADDFECT